MVFLDLEVLVLDLIVVIARKLIRRHDGSTKDNVSSYG